MVGEMRDAETAEIAFRVRHSPAIRYSFSYTNSVIDSFVRLFDMGLERFVVASGASRGHRTAARSTSLRQLQTRPLSEVSRSLLGLLIRRRH